MARGRIPMVRPPRFASGGGAAAAFGMSGAPAVPVPNSRRGRILAQQYADDARGRFTERVFEFPPYDALVPGGSTVVGASQMQTVQVVSNRTSFVRLVALRGILKMSSTTPLTGLELANLMLRLQINGEEDLITSGESSNPSSFEILFSNTTAPWYWFAAPPRLRVGDQLQATITNDLSVESETDLTPELAARIVDDKWWMALYGGPTLRDEEGDDDENDEPGDR